MREPDASAGDARQHPGADGAGEHQQGRRPHQHQADHREALRSEIEGQTAKSGGQSGHHGEVPEHQEADHGRPHLLLPAHQALLASRLQLPAGHLVLHLIELPLDRRHFLPDLPQETLEARLQDSLSIVCVGRGRVTPGKHLVGDLSLAERVRFLHQCLLVHGRQGRIGRQLLCGQPVGQGLPQLDDNHGEGRPDLARGLFAVVAKNLGQPLMATVNIHQLRLNRFQGGTQLLGIGLQGRLPLADLLLDGRCQGVRRLQKAVDVHALALIDQEFAEPRLEGRQARALDLSGIGEQLTLFCLPRVYVVDLLQVGRRAGIGEFHQSLPDEALEPFVRGAAVLHIDDRKEPRSGAGQSLPHELALVLTCEDVAAVDDDRRVTPADCLAGHFRAFGNVVGARGINESDARLTQLGGKGHLEFPHRPEEGARFVFALPYGSLPLVFLERPFLAGPVESPCADRGPLCIPDRGQGRCAGELSDRHGSSTDPQLGHRTGRAAQKRVQQGRFAILEAPGNDDLKRVRCQALCRLLEARRGLLHVQPRSHRGELDDRLVRPGLGLCVSLVE